MYKVFSFNHDNHDQSSHYDDISFFISYEEMLFHTKKISYFINIITNNNMNNKRGLSVRVF
jgi:hypothetical protein